MDTPHAHCTVSDHHGKFLISADLGLDSIQVWNTETIMNKGSDRPFIFRCPKGTGPRQLLFHPFLDVLYCVNENSSTISAFSFNLSSGELQLLQSVSACGNDYHGVNYPAGITTTSDGKFLYVSNRGADTIAVFRVLPSGLLVQWMEFSSCGQFPRHIQITHDDRFLMVCNQKSDQIIIFPIESGTGNLRKPADSVALSEPSCTAEYLRNHYNLR